VATERRCGAVNAYRIESDVELSSEWLPASAFTTLYDSQSVAVATAIEGVETPVWMRFGS
jgi:hypothetical protein